MVGLSKTDIERLFELLNAELESCEVKGEVYVVGGAVMCLAHEARESTKNVDAFFLPSQNIRDAACKIAEVSNIDPDWLNDAVKGYLSTDGGYDSYLELSNLKVFVAQPDYLLAMKCLAMRIGEEFHDLDDVRYLLRYLNITSYKKALATIGQYYPAERFPQKTLYALEELLE